MTLVTIEEMNTRFEQLLQSEGFETSVIQLSDTEYPGRVAENPYFAVAFQPFATWSSLVDSATTVEMDLSNRVEQPTTKTWDTYLLLACQESIAGAEELDQLVKIQYDIKRMRKLVMPGVGERLLKVDQLIRPFVALTAIQRKSALRDPLAALAAKLTNKPAEREFIERAITLFREGRPIDE